MTEKYQICARCIMDTSAPDIKFDDQGQCNFCREYFVLSDSIAKDTAQKEKALQKIVQKIKNDGKGKEYDCILGVSGGLDSSYLLYTAKNFGLRSLAVHLDNGWNSELAVSNIEKLCKSINVDLHTYIINWEEFRALQIAFLKANVIDIEMLTDHAISAILYKMAFKKNIPYILAGTNIVNEGMRMPKGWVHFKQDLRNINDIYKKFGAGKKIRSFPTMGLLSYLIYRFFFGIKWISFLDYVRYDKNEAIKTLEERIGWRPYEKKHYESIFTRFYQGYILPKKFHVDKRKIHYSTLICSGQMTRPEALESMKNNPYDDAQLLREDKDYVLKKLGMSDEEFEIYLKSPTILHSRYASEEWLLNIVLNIQKNIYKYIFKKG